MDRFFPFEIKNEPHKTLSTTLVTKRNNGHGTNFTCFFRFVIETSDLYIYKINRSELTYIGGFGLYFKLFLHRRK